MKKEQKNKISRAAIFFDGTGNNRINSLKNPEKYGNTTNINTLYESCIIREKLYIEGIGTRDGMEDSNFAKATGENLFGTNGYSYGDKLEMGLIFLKGFQRLHASDDIELFVYGFGRGATLARDFAKRALANYRNIRIKFLGIFDTVVSLSFQEPDIHFSDYELERVGRILHLAAIHETRKFFPLTSIRSDGGQRSLVEIKNFYTDKVKEIFVPGAHADVGGGYLKYLNNVYLNPLPEKMEVLEHQFNQIATVVRDDFSGDSSFAIWERLIHWNTGLTRTLDPYRFFRTTNRIQTFLDMARVYFEVMASYTNTFVNQVFFDFNSSIPNDDLIKLKNDLTKYFNENIPHKGPNYNYDKLDVFTHFSAYYGEIDAGETLNTFDHKLLNIEIQNMVEQHSMENLESMNERDVYSTFGLDYLFANIPSNDNWHREVIYG